MAVAVAIAVALFAAVGGGGGVSEATHMLFRIGFCGKHRDNV